LKSITVYHYDAFSVEPNKGNPAGVVLNSEDLTDDEMQEIAKKIGFNETAFPLVSDCADLQIRYFTPGHEVELCGHATMATMYAMKINGHLEDKKDFKIETKAGILPVSINTYDEKIYITMNQAIPKFEKFEGSKVDLAQSIGIDEHDLEMKYPIVYGSTGAWTLLVPVKDLETCKKMKPQNKLFPEILKERPRASVHPFCFETYDKHLDMHARHFSSPYSGTTEDAVTGTASGVMGAYYAQYIKNMAEETFELVIEQGQEIEKNGKVIVHVEKQDKQYDIKITGNAVYVKKIEVEI